MSYGTHLNAHITVTPTVPAEALAGSRYRDRDTGWRTGADLFISDEFGDGTSVITTTSDEERGSRDGANADLKDIVELLGDGYEYTGSIKGETGDGGTDSLFELSIEDGQVIDRDGEIVYGLGDIGTSLSGADIEAALATLAEIYQSLSESQRMDLSERQVEVAENIHSLWDTHNR